MEFDIERFKLRKGEHLPKAKEHPQLSAIHHQQFVGHVTGYCDNQDCMAREVDVFVKNYDADPASNVWCPICRGRLSHLKSIDLAAWKLEREAAARRSVNLQRYIRDHRKPGDHLVMFPLSAAGDDSLPT